MDAREDVIGAEPLVAILEMEGGKDLVDLYGLILLN